MRSELSKNDWDCFVLKHGPRSGQFLQSWNWGEFVKSLSDDRRGVALCPPIDRIAWMSDEDEVVAIAQVQRKKIPFFGTYAYIPRGPISLGSSVDISDVTHNDLFIRVEPIDGYPSPFAKASSDTQAAPLRIIKTKSIQPQHTLITDLAVTTDQLLVNMHKKTRYNIRLAEKKGVVIEIGSASIDDVWPVFEMTASRDTFRLHGKEYYRDMLNTLSRRDHPQPLLVKDGGLRVFLAIAKHEGDILAANIMIDFGKTRTYLHGASSNTKRNFMAPYLLHWELMKDAKSRGITFYDWWGVAPIDAPANHSWAGISRFKRGFGGEEVSYPQTIDVVQKFWRYLFYRVARKIKRGRK